MSSKQKPSKKARNTASRMVAVQCVYDMIITGHDASYVLEGYRDRRHEETFEDIDFVPADLDLLAKIVRGVESRKPELLDMVQGALAVREGRTTQPEALLRALLLCGAFEMLAHLDIDAALLIAEYQTVSNGFFEDSEAKLVNAVLDRLNKALRN